jgi:hypothetical protein
MLPPWDIISLKNSTKAPEISYIDQNSPASGSDPITVAIGMEVED